MDFIIEVDYEIENEIKEYIKDEFKLFMKDNKVDLLDYDIETNNFRAFCDIDPNYIPAILFTIKLSLECDVDIFEIISLFFSNFALSNNRTIEVDEKNKKFKIQGYNGKDAINIIKELKK